MNMFKIAAYYDARFALFTVEVIFRDEIVLGLSLTLVTWAKTLNNNRGVHLRST